MTRLTLSVARDVAEQAKRIAKADGTSVSAMFSEFVRSLSARRWRRGEIGPLTRQASGLVRLPPDKDYKDLLADALAEKYRIQCGSIGQSHHK